MLGYTASSTNNALLIFADIVDSSVHSSFLGTMKFANKVLKFQELFRTLGRSYFYNKTKFDKRIDSLCIIDSRGDEGHVFIVDPEQKADELVLRGVKFALELKARQKILNLKEEDLPPKEMKIAIGIHYGEVALVTTTEEKEGIFRTLIDRIMGYSINYAKRVESSSRIGRFSQVFLSKEAANLLSYSPVALFKHETSLKGIESRDEVYEVRSAFLDEVPASVANDAGGISNEQFVNHFDRNYKEIEFLREPWLKSFVLSILNAQWEATKGTEKEKEYFDKISKIAWHKPIEDDPLMLFWRARECEESNKYSRAVKCLKDILKKYPYFIHARIKIIDTCFKMVRSEDKTSSELIFVRDTAEEMLEKYKGLLAETEKNRLEEILQQMDIDRKKEKKKKRKRNSIFFPFKEK